MKKILKDRTYLFLSIFFVIAVFIRFLYFPSNIYFGYDQARDAFISQEIPKGQLKIIGPSTSFEGFFHGVLYYYIFGLIYNLSAGNPEAISAFLRLFNSLGVFLVFFIGNTIYDKKVGLLAALLFVFSFEQTQYALYMNHPPLALISVLSFYLGLSLIIFKNNPFGWILTLAGLGFSVQFELVLSYLTITLLALLIFFKKDFLKTDKKYILHSLLIFFLAVSSYIIAELKFHLTSFESLSSLITSRFSQGSKTLGYIQNISLISKRFVNDNIFAGENFLLIIFITLIALFTYFFLRYPSHRKGLGFLLIWFLSGSIPYLSNDTLTPIYYYSVGASVGCLVFVAFLLEHFSKRSVLVTAIFLSLIVYSNINLIGSKNPLGSLPEINVQSGMLLEQEKEVLDFIYTRANRENFSINALSMPYNVNTTWSYLFEWYGYRKYHYLPIWGGDKADGYPGNLVVERSRSKLPNLRFVIVEPLRGIYPWLVDDFLREESYFSEIKEEKKFGQFRVQVRNAI